MRIEVERNEGQMNICMRTCGNVPVADISHLPRSFYIPQVIPFLPPSLPPSLSTYLRPAFECAPLGPDQDVLKIEFDSFVDVHHRFYSTGCYRGKGGRRYGRRERWEGREGRVR